MNWRKIYLWEVEVNGKKIQQFPADLSMEKIIKKYGRVDVLSLIPQKAGFHRLNIVIPKGAVAVYKREVNKSTIAGQSYLKFKVGWSAPGVHVLNLINARNGDVELKVVNKI